MQLKKGKALVLPDASWRKHRALNKKSFSADLILPAKAALHNFLWNKTNKQKKPLKQTKPPNINPEKISQKYLHF